ncbi:unnamed protein product, partial [marine sediment metagenome]
RPEFALGWGLGLAITKRIVEEYHNGRILLESTQFGSGSTFLIYLPAITRKNKKT